MILNTLGATFILDIDNFAYSYFITDIFKDAMRAIPPIGVSEGLGMTLADAFWQMLGAYLFIPTGVRRRCKPAGATPGAPWWRGSGWAFRSSAAPGAFLIVPLRQWG